MNKSDDNNEKGYKIIMELTPNSKKQKDKF